MIDNDILDQIFPVQDLDEMKKEQVSRLQQNGFTITNFNSGGIFNTILMIILQARMELTQMLRSMLNTLYVRHADEEWLGLLAADFSKTRKSAVKTKGNLTLRRREGAGAVIIIPAGTVFKTDVDINGEELRFFSTRKVVIPKEEASAEVPVEAEMEGSRYNIPPLQITRCLQNLEGIQSISNEKGWITTEGSDIEEWESLRDRTLGAWDLLATMPTAAKYKNICESIDGVMHVNVNQLHPRGQGTVDIIVTSTAGEAAPELMAKVQEAAEQIKAPDDDVLVKSAVTVYQDLILQVILPKLVSDEGIDERVRGVIARYFRISNDRNLNEFIHYDLLYAIKNSIPLIKNVKILSPEEDVILDADKVIICGTIDITIRRE